MGSLRDPVTTLPSPFKKELGRTLGLNQRNMPTLIKMNLESYISGYVDGEGCFCVSIRPRKGNKTGWENESFWKTKLHQNNDSKFS